MSEVTVLDIGTDAREKKENWMMMMMMMLFSIFMVGRSLFGYRNRHERKQRTGFSFPRSMIFVYT